MRIGLLVCRMEAQNGSMLARSPQVAEHAKFLTLLIGRGFFYLFLGSLTVSVAPALSTHPA